MAYNDLPPLGQTTKSASLPVTIASDQDVLATSAKQDTIIGHVDGIEGLLTTIDADTGEISAHIGTLSDAAATVGGTGSLSAKLRLQTTQLDAIQTAVQTLDNAIVGSEMQVDVVAALPTGANTIGSVASITTSVTPGTAAANLGKAEDAAHTTGDVGVMALAVRRDTAAASSGTTGDYEPLSTDATGRLWIVGAGIEDAAETAGGTLLMAGSVRRDTAASSAGTTGDNATINTDSVGALWTRSTGELADDAAFTAGTSRVTPAGFFADETATDSVDEGDTGAARMTLDRKQIVSVYAHTAGGATPYKLVSAATTNATSVKASAGTVYMITASNVNAAVRYLKLYNKASAPTVGTDTPVFTFAIPGNTAGAGTNIPVPTVGLNFGTGIAFALTTEATDAGSTGVAANEIVVNLAYL